MLAAITAENRFSPNILKELAVTRHARKNTVSHNILTNRHSLIGSNIRTGTPLNPYTNHHITTNSTTGLDFPRFVSDLLIFQHAFATKLLQRVKYRYGYRSSSAFSREEELKVEMFIAGATEHKTQQLPSRRLRKFGNYAPRAQSKSPKKMVARTDRQTSSA